LAVGLQFDVHGSKIREILHPGGGYDTLLINTLATK
jgi:hypothetical protein